MQSVEGFCSFLSNRSMLLEKSNNYSGTLLFHAAGDTIWSPLTRVSICDTSLRQHNINHCPNHQCKPQHSKREQQIDNYIVLICAVLWLCTVIFCRVHSCRWAGMHCTVIASTTAGAGRAGKCALEGLRIVGVTLCTLAKISVICHVLYILSVPFLGL